MNASCAESPSMGGSHDQVSGRSGAEGGTGELTAAFRDYWESHTLGKQYVKRSEIPVGSASPDLPEKTSNSENKTRR